MASLMAPIESCPIRWQAIHHSQHIAFKTDNQSISYLQLDNLLIQLQTQLENKINTTGDHLIRLVCISPNSLELLLLQLVCLRMGWCFCPINPRFTATEVNQRLKLLNSDYCWVSDDSPLQKFNTLKIDFDLQAREINDQLSLLPIIPEQACNIIFTSGSSGFPKAIVHNYKNHFYSALGSQDQIPLVIEDNNLLSLPLFHIGGYATVIRTMIAGACLHLSDQPLTFPLLQERQITHLSLVSTQLVRLLEDPKFTKAQSSIKHILLGGSAFPRQLLSSLVERDFNYHLSYGCTEMASQVATSTNSEALTILPYREVKIDNEVILLRGETRFLGYFKNNKLVELDAKQWINIGDTGQLNENIVTILGRQDRQFISGGENIKPEEIEQTSLQKSNVKQAYASPINDTQYGQRVALFVEFEAQKHLTFEQQSKQLQHYLQKKLTTFKQPDYYLPWPQSNSNQALKIPKAIFETILKNKGLI